LVSALGIDGAAVTPLRLVRDVIARGRGVPGHASGFGAATEVQYHLLHGRAVQFLRMPRREPGGEGEA
jgi:hypothetical protein